MSIVSLSTVGKNKFKLSIFRDEYIAIDGFSESPGHENFSEYISKFGTDLVSLLTTTTEPIVIDLIDLGDGYKITLEKIEADKVTGYRGKETWYGAQCFIYYVTPDGNKSSIWYNLTSLYYKVGSEIKKTFNWYFGIADSDGVLIGCHALYGMNDTNEIEVAADDWWMHGVDRNRLLGLAVQYDSDPWSTGGYADVGGGDGELDLSSDVISLPELPPSFTETGFIQIFSPTLYQIRELSSYMWNASFFENLLKLFSNPMDIIIGLSMYPFPIPKGGSRGVHAGNVLTTIQMDYPESQYVQIDCGSIEIKHFYNAYIDYEPYTTCQIYLPYIGIESLNMDDIMGKTIHVIYRVDLLTGSCGAFILCDDVILYNFTGGCSSQIPVSGQSFQSMVQSAINIATTTATAKGAGKTSKGEPVPSNKPQALAASLGSNVMSMKPDVTRAGSISSNVGMLSPQKPYLIFSVPRTCLPKGQNTYLGYPTFMSIELSSLKGYTEIERVWLNNMSCTDEEKKEIEERLQGGVIL